MREHPPLERRSTTLPKTTQGKYNTPILPTGLIAAVALGILTMDSYGKSFHFICGIIVLACLIVLLVWVLTAGIDLSE